jgi:hypothetical protein
MRGYKTPITRANRVLRSAPIVYRLFDLTADEIALLEASLEGQY